MDLLQLQQLMHPVARVNPQPQVSIPSMQATSDAPKQTVVVECPKSMVGRVIGKCGETIKALQQYTGAMIQIDQSMDPTRITVAGNAHSVQLAVSIVSDITRGTFKGFSMLRQVAMGTGLPEPLYVEGYGLVPAQVLPPETALLGGKLNENMIPSMTSPTVQANSSVQDALIAHLLNQLLLINTQQQQQQYPGLAFLAQSDVTMHSSQQHEMPPNTSLMLSAQGTPAVFDFSNAGGGSSPLSSSTASSSLKIQA